MHLAVDAVGARRGGSATGVLEFLRAAIPDARVTRISVFCSPPSERLFDFPDSPKLSLITQKFAHANYLVRTLWYEVLTARACARIGADLLFASCNFGRSGPHIPHVTYIRQSLPFSPEAVCTFDSWYDRLRIRAYGVQMRRSCLGARRVICQSGEMKRLLCKNFGIPAHKIEAVRMSPRVLPEATGRYPAIEPMLNTPRGARILYVGDAHSYRMLDTAVSGMTTVRQTRDDARLFMTIGREHAFGSKPGVHPLPYLNPEELSAAYDAADALVLPSLIESCPQPPLEAMSFGVPTLLADRPYAHDIFGDAALYFNPGNPNDFAEKCLRLLGDETLRRRLIEAGRNLVNAARTSQPYTRMVDICCEEYANSRSEALQRK